MRHNVHETSILQNYIETKYGSGGATDQRQCASTLRTVLMTQLRAGQLSLSVTPAKPAQMAASLSLYPWHANAAAAAAGGAAGYPGPGGSSGTSRPASKVR